MSFDSILNVAVPILLVFIGGATLYTKLFKPFLAPMFEDVKNWASGKKEGENSQQTQVITYDI